MRVRLLNFGRPYKARHSAEPHKPYGSHPENTDPKEIERQDPFSCRSFTTDAMDKTELVIQLSRAELVSEIRLDGYYFIRRKDAVIDQNFADLAVEKGVVDTLSDITCARHSIQHRILIALAEYLEAIDVE
jgi:hypothetical protein